MPPKKVTATPPRIDFETITIHPKDHFEAPKLDASDRSDLSVFEQVNSKHDTLMFGITDIPKDVCGRRVVARQTIEPGTTVLIEQSPLWSVLYGAADAVCHNCCKLMQQVKTSDACSDPSGTWKFCSSSCKSAMEPLWALEAPLVPHLASVTAAVDIDADLLRTSIRFLLSAALGRESPGSAQSGESVFTSSPAAIRAMVGHSQYDDPEVRQTAVAAARMLWPVLPAPVARAYKEAGLPGFVDDLLAISSRINANIHGLCLSDKHNTQFGIGLFPLGAMFNHSCFPNCVFVNDGARLLIRAIRRVDAGEELLINYICLGQARLARQAELLREKSFLCACSRCLLRPQSLEAYNKLRAEVLLQGVRCASLSAAEAAKVDVRALVKRYTAPVEAAPLEGEAPAAPAEEPVAVPAAVPAGKATKGKGKGKGKASLDALLAPAGPPCINDVVPRGVFIPVPRPPSATADPEAWAAEQAQAQFVSSADAATLVSFAQLREMEAPAQAAAERAVAVYSANGVTMDMRRKAVEAAVAECTRRLAPGHELFFTLYPLLVNVCARSGDHRARLDAALAMAALSEAFMPDRFLPLANTYEGVLAAADALETDMNASGSRAALLKRACGARVAEARADCLPKLVSVLQTCYGAAHARTVEAKDRAAKHKVTV